MYDDIADLLAAYPGVNFNIIDSWMKAWAMTHGQFHRILCDIPQNMIRRIIIKDIIQKCDSLGRVDYAREEGKDYDLIIGEEQNGTSAYTECAGDGRYRPIFWYDSADVTNYQEKVLDGLSLD